LTRAPRAGAAAGECETGTMPADDTNIRGDADLETTHLNDVLEETVLENAVLGNAALGNAAREGAVGDPAQPGVAPGGDAEPEEEWPPREWRETTRSAGHRQAAYVALGMIAVFAVIAVIAVWASHNG